MSNSRVPSAGPSAPKSPSDSDRHPKLDSGIQRSAETPLTNISSSALRKESIKDAIPPTTDITAKSIVEPVPKESHSLPSAQLSTRNKSDDAKESSVAEKQLQPASISSSLVRIQNTVKDSPEAAHDQKDELSSDNKLGVKSEVPRTSSIPSSESDEATITETTELRHEQLVDTDTDDDDSLQESDSYSGYEHVSKTILRKSDTIIRSSSRGKSPKKDTVEEEPIHLEIKTSTGTSDTKENIQSTVAVTVAESVIEHVSSSLPISSPESVSKPDSPVQIVTEKTEKKDKKFKKGKDTTKQKDKNASDSKKGKSKPSPPTERKPKRKPSPSGLLEERLTSTVIRRHVKPKPPESVASKTRSVSATVSDVVSTSDEIKGQTVSLDASCSKELSVQKSSDNISTETVSSRIQSESKERTLSKVEKTVTLVSIPKNGLKPSRADEILVKENEPKISSLSKTTTTELKGTNGMSPNHGSSSTSSPIIKHVSIKEPPESIPCRDSNVAAQSSEKKPFKSALAKDSAGPSQKPATSVEEESDDSKNHVENDVESVPVTPKNKSCCFCWCCCCSCSCEESHPADFMRSRRTTSLSMKANKRKQKMSKTKRRSRSMEMYFEVEESPPTLEEIRTWGESFDKLMKCAGGRKVFREFLKCEYSEENILFWLACEDFKKETVPKTIEKKAKIIYEDFISILSPREVSLDSKVRDAINKTMLHPTITIFDDAQLQIYTLMHRDSYPRFVNSTNFRKLAKLPVSSRKGSTA